MTAWLATALQLVREADKIAQKDTETTRKWLIRDEILLIMKYFGTKYLPTVRNVRTMDIPHSVSGPKKPEDPILNVFKPVMVFMGFLLFLFAVIYYIG